MEDQDDPFAGLTLDDDFVNAATRHEETGEERVERLRRIARDHRRLEEEQEAERAQAARELRRAARRPGRLSRLLAGRRWLTILVVLSLAAGAVWVTQPGGGEQESAEPAVDGGAAGNVTRVAEAGGPHPSPATDASSTRLEVEVPVPEAEGSYEFTAEQPDGSGPIAYDPCRAIHWVTNDRLAPEGAEGLTAEAVAMTGRATGLRFEDDGESSEPAEIQREAYQPDRYGDRWAPVLVAWTDPDEVADLEGFTAGVGGSVAWQEAAGSHAVYVSGIVFLDGPQMADVIEVAGPEAARAIILHELGHLLGLDHVDDRVELMHPETSGATAFGPGDLQGLALLGKGRCFPGV